MKRRARGEGSIGQEPNGWRGYVTVDGARIYRRGRTKAEVAQKLKEVKSGQKRTARAVPSLLEFTKNQLEGPLKQDLRYGTWSMYEGFWRTKLAPHSLGSLRLDRIRKADVQAFVDDHRSIYAPSSLRRVGSFVCMILERATDLELIPANPARRVRYPPIPETEKTVLNPAEARELPDAAISPRLASMLLVAIHTGLRRGELCGLKWEDVDFANRVIHVRRQIVRAEKGITESPPKTKRSIRDVELTDAALEAITSQPNRCVYVFSTESGNPLRPDTLSRDFNVVKQRTRFKSLRLHELRASYISILLELGVDVRTVQELAGHTSSAITQEVYARSRRELKRRAADALQEHLKK